VTDDLSTHPDHPLPIDGPPPRWRPPVVVRLIAVWQAVAGVALAWYLLTGVAHGTPISWWCGLLAEAIVVAATVGGVALWRGEPPGFLISCVLQLLQVVRLYTRSFAFVLLLGPSLTAIFPSQGDPSFQGELRSRLTWIRGRMPESVGTGFAINSLAIFALVVLLIEQRRSGQPWLRWSGAKVEWDRARLIGAYQIGAGVLGMVNSTFVPNGIGNLLFSAVVIASGVALFRHARWSDGIAVAVNAVQIPVLSIAHWTVLLRSGLSCVVALASGARPGLRFQFDVGSVINGTLADGIDSFVGINLVAVALVLLLINYDAPYQPVEERASRRFEIRKF
jgi:hypothetical protein